MAYDPILCMNIPDSVSTKDSDFYQIRFGSGKIEGYKGELGETKEYVKALMKKYGEKSAFVSQKGKPVFSFIGPIDKALKVCDADVSLVKTVAKKNGYAVHIVRGQYGERIVLTFPNEHYTNPHMWLGENNSSNLSKAQALLNDFANAK